MFRYCTIYIVHYPYSTVSESLSNGMQNHEINSGPATVSDFESNFGAVQSNQGLDSIEYSTYITVCTTVCTVLYCTVPVLYSTVLYCIMYYACVVKFSEIGLLPSQH